MFRKDNLRKFLNQNYALIVIIIGAMLITFSIAPFQTLDTKLEFDTTRSILRVGWPILPSTGEILNEPPLGFYTAALFFKVVNFTIVNGTNLVTLFGIGCAIAIYFIGKEFYGKSASLFSAAFFILAPWELFLSRTYLIDAQCLFLSLLCLFFGIRAIQKDSSKLALVSGIFFAVALLTKLYAVFMLIPLLLIYFYHRPKGLRLVIYQITAFTIPAIYANLLWYQIILKENMLDYFFFHNDFQDVNFPWVVPSYSFITNFLVNYGIGFLFVATVTFSLLVGLVFRKHISKKLFIFDLICLATLLLILGVNMYLAVNLNLKAPYTSAIKFSYQSLPFFSLLAGSLVAKNASIIDYAKKSTKLKKIITTSLALIGVFLLFAPIIVNMNTTHQLSTISYIVFQVQPGVDLGYSFYVENPIRPDGSLIIIQFLGFILILLGLLSTGRNYFKTQFTKYFPLLIDSH